MRKNRDYYILPSQIPTLSDSYIEREKLSDEFWINLIHSHLLNFYNNFDRSDLNLKLENEKKKKGKKYIEDLLKDYIKDWLENKNKKMFRQGIILNLESKVKYNQIGFYDMKFQHSDWVDYTNKTHKYYPLECKNLIDSDSKLLNEYIYINNKSKTDGGVYRYFNGKYAQKQNFGGMLGFVISGNVKSIKDKIFKKLETPKFDSSPDGDLKNIIDASIFDSEFTFNSIHSRKGEVFTIYHLLFDFNQ